MLLVLVMAVAAWGLSQALVRQMLYPAPPVPVPSPAPAPLQEQRLKVEGVGEILAWWLPVSRPGAGMVLMLHGNGENLETMRTVGIFEEFQRLGTGVLALDYPGYGRSSGQPGEISNRRAADAALKWLSATAGRRHPRVVMGWSLGAAVAAQAAAGSPQLVDGIVLLSAWTNLSEAANHLFPSFMVRALVEESYDSLGVADRLAGPKLVVHGERDRLIPVELGERLAAALPEPKRWVVVPEAGHNDLLARPEVWRQLAEFLGKLTPPAPDE